MLTAMVTPFDEKGEVDYDQAKKLALALIDSGSEGLIVVGTTGESPTLVREEEYELFRIVKEVVGDRGAVVAGTGSNSTAEAVAATKGAEKIGVDACLLVVPYYNNPTQEGLYQHFKTIAESTSLPCIPYNVPSRTVRSLTVDTIVRLSEIDNIIGIKEASGSLQQISEIINLCDDSFNVISGDDFLTFPVLAIGGKGVISVTANLVPGDVAQLYDSFKEGDYSRAKALHYKLLPLNNAMFFETNPIPAKTALGLLKRISGEMRLPLAPMSDLNLKKLKEVMKAYGLI